MNRVLLKSCLAFCIALAGVLSIGTACRADDADSGWSISLTPYAWLPSMSGSLNFSVPPSQGGGAGDTINTSVSSGNYLSSINFAAMLAAEIRHDRFVMAGDFMNAVLSPNGTTIKTFSGPGGIVVVPVTFAAQTHFSGTILEGEIGETLLRGHAGNLDGMIGIRYAAINGSIAWQANGPLGIFNPVGSSNGSLHLTDGLLALKGRLNLGSAWFVPYYIDGGVGSSAFTWQAIGGIGVQLNKWTSIQLIHRSINYNETGTALWQNVRLSGPALAATLKL